MGCLMLVMRCVALLLCLLAVLPRYASSLKMVHLPGNSVRLSKSTAVLFHTSGDCLVFFAISVAPNCWFYEMYEVDVLESLGSNPVLKDAFGRQWYELSYIPFRSSLIVKIYGKKSHFIPRKWKFDARCYHMEMVFTFVSPNISLGTPWNKKLLNSFFPQLNNIKNISEFNMTDLEFKKFNHSNDVEKLYTFEEAEPINYNFDDLLTRGSRYLTMDNVYCLLLVVAIIMVLFCMCCCVCPGKKMPEHVKTVTIVRRIPVVEPESSSPVRGHQHPDLPPPYDDIEQDTPPPPYTSVHYVQVIVSDASSCLAQPCYSALEQNSPTEASFVALEVVRPQQPSPSSGETTPAAQMLPVTTEPSPISADSETVSPAAQPFPMIAETASLTQPSPIIA